MKKLLLSILAACTVLSASPAFARDDFDRRSHRESYREQHYRHNHRGHYQRDYRYVDTGQRYRGSRPGYYNYDGRSYRCRDKGNGGLVLGAIAGGLLGRTIDRDGDRTMGTVGGAVVGGALGRAIDRDCR